MIDRGITIDYSSADWLQGPDIFFLFISFFGKKQQICVFHDKHLHELCFSLQSDKKSVCFGNL